MRGSGRSDSLGWRMQEVWPGRGPGSVWPGTGDLTRGGAAERAGRAGSPGRRGEGSESLGVLLQVPGSTLVILQVLGLTLVFHQVLGLTLVVHQVLQG